MFLSQQLFWHLKHAGNEGFRENKKAGVETTAFFMLSKFFTVTGIQ